MRHLKIDTKKVLKHYFTELKVDLIQRLAYFSAPIFLCQNGNNFKLVLTQKRPQMLFHLVLIRSTATKTKAKWSLDLNCSKPHHYFLFLRSYYLTSMRAQSATILYIYMGLPTLQFCILKFAL